MRCPILLVEDDPDIREALSDVLRAEGYEVAEAVHGQMALDWLRAGNRPCLILLDLMMPVMDGWAFRRAQLEDPELSRLPVIVVSAAGPRLGAIPDAELLEKPVRVTDLLERVAKHCGHHLD